MKPEDRCGVYFYEGTTQSGKTKRAAADAWADRDALIDARGQRWPILVINSQGVWNFKDWPHVSTVEEAIGRLWKSEEELKAGGKRENVAIIPTSEEQVDKLFDAARAGKDVIILVDEARFWLSKRRISDSVSRGLRVWAHSRLVLRFTTQRLADIHNDALACHREIYVFRTVDPADLETLRDRYGVDPARAKSLTPDTGRGPEPDGEFLTIRYAELQEKGKQHGRKEAVAPQVPPGQDPVHPGGVRPATPPSAPGWAPVGPVVDQGNPDADRGGGAPPGPAEKIKGPK